MGNENKTILLILFGGVSSEHEVSRVSAASVLSHADSGKYEILKAGITKQGEWFLTESTGEEIESGLWEQSPSNRRMTISADRRVHGILAENPDGTYEVKRVDVVFPVLHGKNGEDGTVQGLLELAGIPFVGPGCCSSAASMDKTITKAVVQQAGVVEQATCCIVHRAGCDIEEAVKQIDGYFESVYPLFVKPSSAGSSVGITKVKSRDTLGDALRTAFAEDSKVLVEETIVGREIEVAVLGNDYPQASCIGEIFAANEFYDYNAKYENAESMTGFVSDLSPEKEQEIRDKAVAVYKVMGCKGLSRIDFFLTEDGRVVFNELNTIPGFTSISMYPQLWEACGVPYDELIDKLVEFAME